MPRWLAVVPTLGRSPQIEKALRALRSQAPSSELAIVVVAQGDVAELTIDAPVDHIVRHPVNLGFAAATNLGIATVEAPFVLTVNDDAVVEPGWLETLDAALAEAPDVVAAQGVNRRLTAPTRLDGWGLGWNRWWQAVQLGHDRPTATAPDAITEVFGVSATAALYRREALIDGASGRRGFDERLVSYYEDVMFAVVSRHRGRRALTVPGATAAHAGSTTGITLPEHRRLLVANRWLTVATLVGRAWPWVWPRVILRDLADVHRHGDLRGMLTGWGRALRLLPRFLHRAAPLNVTDYPRS